jgi:hypothetical protein
MHEGAVVTSLTTNAWCGAIAVLCAAVLLLAAACLWWVELRDRGVWDRVSNAAWRLRFRLTIAYWDMADAVGRWLRRHGLRDRI